MMEVWLAQFAKILVWEVVLVDQAHAATVLPDRAEIALDEEVAEIVAEGFEGCIESV